MIKLLLLTGFLGAGKTTFLNHILEEYKENKIGLIINEFSAIGVDGALVQRQKKEMDRIELNNGSIFCACIKDKFVDALLTLSKKDLEYVFIEASGLADPASISSILEGIAPHTVRDYEYCGSICLVDAVTFPLYARKLPALVRQVEYGRAVIVNKADLADEEELRETRRKLWEINPRIPVYETSFGQVSMKEILSGKAAEAPASRESGNRVETRPKTVTLATGEAISGENLRAFLKEITPFAYRVKGFVKMEEGAGEVSAVGTYVSVRPWPEPVEKTGLVIISSVGIRIVSLVLRAAEQYFKEQVELIH